MADSISFEIPAADTERAINFYSQAFDWQIHQPDGTKNYWLVTTGAADRPHTSGGLMKSNQTGSWINTVEVDSLDEQIDRIVASGGRPVSEKVAIPGIGWLAYCQDTEGNLFAVMENDPHALK